MLYCLKGSWFHLNCVVFVVVFFLYLCVLLACLWVFCFRNFVYVISNLNLFVQVYRGFTCLYIVSLYSVLFFLNCFDSFCFNLAIYLNLVYICFCCVVIGQDLIMEEWLYFHLFIFWYIIGSVSKSYWSMKNGCQNNWACVSR